MAILASNGFDYRVVLNVRGASWCGRADSSSEHLWRGLAGDAPDVEISHDVLSLHRTDDASTYEPHYYGIGGPPMQASFAIGDFLRTHIQDGDCVHLTRGSYGDLGLRLFRGNELILGLGSIASGATLGDLTVTPDPRAADLMNYRVRDAVEDPATHLLWIEASPTVDAATILDNVPAGTRRVVVAITGADAEQRHALNNRAWPRMGRWPRPPGPPTLHFADIDPGVFPSQDDWLAYLRGLPRTRPTDLYLRFHYHGYRQDVAEGGDAWLSPWRVAVRRVRTIWRAEQIGVIRDADADPGALHLAIRQCYEARMSIT